MTTKKFSAIEIVLYTLFGFMSFSGGACTLLFIIGSIDNPENWQMVAIPLGFTLASVSSVVLLGFRRLANVKTDWFPLGSALVLWFMGLNTLGWAVATVFMYDEPSEFMSNLEQSIAMCWVPGIFLTLLSLIVYGYEYWHNRAAVLATTVNAPLEKLNRADKIHRATEYRDSIINLIKQKDIHLTDQLFFMTTLDRLEVNLRALVQRLESFEKNPLMQRDLKNLPKTITQLAEQLKNEPNPEIKAQMQQNLARYHEQRHQLDLLVTLMRRIELKIDETLALLGTLYSQMQLFKAKDIDSSPNQRLTNDLDEQVKTLDDLLTAVDEVYHDSAVAG